MARNRYFDDEIIVEKFNAKMLKRMLLYSKPYKKQMLRIIIIMMLVSAIVLLPPVFNRFIVDFVITKKGVAGLDYLTLGILLLTGWGLVMLTDIVFTLIRSKVMAKLGYTLIRDLRRDTFANLQRLAFDYYDSRPAGKILVRLTSYIDEIANIFTSSVVGILVDGSKLVIVLIIMYIIDWRLAGIITISVIPMAFGLMLLHKRMAKLYRIHRNKHSNHTAYLAESINGIPVIKAFNRQDLNIEINADLNRQRIKSWRNVIASNNFFFPLVDVFYQLGTMGVYAFVLICAQSTHFDIISLGTLASFIMFLGQFSSPLNNIANIIQELSVASSNLERVFETLDTPSSVSDCEGAYDLPAIKGHIKFDNVSFCYEKGKNVLENFNLEVEAGKCVALVGPTGGGKTTVVSLICRFYNVSQNSITIDGHDIAKVKLHSLRSQIGVMMQDTFVFSGTIMENIRYANLNATDQDCIDAARAVFADDFIRRLPNGYQTVVSEQGSELSTGERQLLSFARVIVSDPKILILDEATSSIDTQTEENIQKALATILQGRTSFIIAHRLSTIKKADCILFIKDKGIAEAGTHEQLIEKKGLYYSLATGNH